MKATLLVSGPNRNESKAPGFSPGAKNTSSHQAKTMKHHAKLLKQYNSRGFTLTEAVVAVAIIGSAAIFAVIFLNKRVGRLAPEPVRSASIKAIVSPIAGYRVSQNTPKSTGYLELPSIGKILLGPRHVCRRPSRKNLLSQLSR